MSKGRCRNIFPVALSLNMRKLKNKNNNLKLFVQKSVFLFVLVSSFPALALAWNGNPFIPGTTLNPDCLPTDPNCDVQSVSALNPILYSTSTGIFSILQASSTSNGYISSLDWNIFNNKQNSLGNLNGLVVGDGAGNYSTTTNNSANWNSTYNTVNSSSSNWNSAYNTVNASSTFWNTAYSWGNHAGLYDILGTATSTLNNWLALNPTSGTNTGDETETTIKNKLGSASSNSDGYLSLVDWNTFNNKENAISLGTTGQYLRGDKTFQNLDTSNVPENGNLYFTNARADARANLQIGAATSTIRNLFSSLNTALEYNPATGQFDVNSSNNIPLNASTTNWENSYNIVNSSSSNWNSSSNKVTASSTFWDTAYSWGNHATAGYLSSILASSTYAKLTGAIFSGNISALNFSGSSSGTNTGDETQSSIKTKLGVSSSGVDGYLGGSDWNIFNGKQNAITLGTTGQYFRGDLSLATFPTNLSSFTNGPGYITGNQSITLSGDLSGTGTTSISTTLPNVNSSSGTYQGITFNAKGLITGGTNQNYITAAGAPVQSVFGRTGSVTATSGDYNTSQVTENGNLYFTNARAVSALTGQNVSLLTNDANYITNSTGLFVNNTTDSTLTKSGTGPYTLGLNLGNGNTWTGQQTFNTSAPIFGTMTSGSVPFFGTGGVLSQNNSNLFWDNTNNRLGIGTTSPSAQLSLVKADSSALTDFLVNPTLKTSGNLIDLQVGGSSRFKLDSGGNLTFGANNTSPVLTLLGYSNLTITNGVNINGSLRSARFSSNTSVTTEGFDFYSAYSNKSLFFVRNDGNVGIGTTTPASKLDIYDTTLAGSGSLAGSILNLAPTWNTTGAPTAINLNVTNTASLSTSLLMNLQVGGSSKFKVRSDGLVTAASNVSAAALILPGYVDIGSTIAGVGMAANGVLAWSSTSNASAATGLSLFRDAADDTLAQRRSTNAQTFRIYNTYTDASNYERGVFDWKTTSNTLRIGTEALGTGTLRNIDFVGGNVGIGTTTPTSKLDVNGTVSFETINNCSSGIQSSATGVLSCYSSDERIKQNIIPLTTSNGLDLINQLNPVTFNYKDPNQAGGTQYGFIAQDVQGVLPGLVATSSYTTPWTPDGTLTLNYQGIIAPLVEAVKEIGGKIKSIMSWFGGDGSKMTVQGDVCVDDVCVTKDQFKAMLRNAGAVSNIQTQTISTVQNPTEQTPVATTSSTSTSISDQASSTQTTVQSDSTTSATPDSTSGTASSTQTNP